MNYPSIVRGAVTGNYPVIGDINEADCVGAHAFGLDMGPDSVNAHLARIANEYGAHLDVPVMMEADVANVHAQTPPTPDFVVSVGATANMTGRIGAYGALQQFKEFMKEHDLHRPILVGHAHHIGRVAVQARKLELNPIIPAGMPRMFNSQDEQKWVRNRRNWVTYETTAAYFGMKLVKKQI